MIGRVDCDVALCCRMRNSRPQVAASGRVLERAILNPFLIQNLLVERHRPHLVARRIRGIDAQVLLHPVHGQIGILLQMLGRNPRRSHRRGSGAGRPLTQPHASPQHSNTAIPHHATRTQTLKSQNSSQNASKSGATTAVSHCPTLSDRQQLLHAVFISGFPKLPCPCLRRLSSRLQRVLQCL